MEPGETYPGEHVKFPEDQHNWVKLRVPTNDKYGSRQLATYRWKSETPPRAVLMLVHGFTSFADAMAIFAKQAVQRGFETVAIDLRGFGRSRGTDQGNFDSIDMLVADVVTYFKKVKKRYPDLPFFVLGCSLGGHISLKLSLAVGNACRGIVVCVPLVDLKTPLAQNWFTRRLLLALSKVIGWVAVPTPDYNDSFRISKAYTDTMNHPLQHVGPIYMSTVLAMMRSCDEMKNNLQEYKLPMLIFRVGVDSMVCNVAIEKLYEKAGSQDKTLIDYPNAWHSIQKDPEVYDMCKRAIGWMEARL